MSADLLPILLRANLAAGLAILAVLALRRPLRRKAGATAAYALWLIVPLAMAGAVVPPRTITVMTAPPAAINVAVQAAAPTSTPVDYSPLLLGVWLAGVALSLAILVERQRRFRVTLGRLTRDQDGVLRAESPGGPAVLGALRPRIVLPCDFEQRFPAPERQAILAHERQHLAAAHPQTNGLVAFLQCLCWFNPLVWMATHAMRLDQELACDAATLSRSSSLSPRLYGEALLRTQLNAPPLPLGCHWPSSGVESLKERLLMLKSPNPNRRARLLGAAMLTGLCTAGAVAAWAAQPVRTLAILQPEPAALRAAGLVFLRTTTDETQSSLIQAQRRLAQECGAAAAAGSSHCATLQREADTARRLLQGLDVQRVRLEAAIPGPALDRYTRENAEHVAALHAQSDAHVARLAAASASQPPAITSNSVAGHQGVIVPPEPEPQLVTNPDWLEKPTVDKIAKYFPENALRSKQPGVAVIRCAVADTGKLQDCSVVSEKPEGQHFGQAAVLMAREFTMVPPSNGGSPFVNIPIRFNLQ